MADILGCETHLLQVIDRDGGQLGELTSVASLTWERRRNEASIATVVIEMGELGQACCELLSQLRTWRHDLRIIRGGEVVWTGTVMEIDLGPVESSITAYDHAIWLDRRIIHEEMSFSDTDVVSIAEQVITAAMQPDEPGILNLLYPIESGDVIAEYTITANSQTALEILTDLGIFGLGWTMVMGRMFLSSLECLGNLGSLDDRYVDGMRVVESGLDAITSATVAGQDGIFGTAEGEHQDYYGKVERLTLEDDVSTSRAAEEIAQRQVTDAALTPLVIRMENGLGMLPETPFDINQLIPGVCVLAQSSGTCREVTQEIQLLTLTVEETHDTEAIRGTFGTPGADVDRQVA